MPVKSYQQVPDFRGWADLPMAPCSKLQMGKSLAAGLIHTTKVPGDGEDVDQARVGDRLKIGT